jgi:hypothetical protein
MPYTSVIKSSLLALIPVLAVLAVWILYRAENLVRLSFYLEPGFFVPANSGQAIRNGYLIWFVVSFLVSFICGYLYYLVTQKWHWKALYYAIFITAVAVTISLLAFISGLKLAVEATGEILIMAIGFGVFIPWFAQQNLRNYS